MNYFRPAIHILPSLRQRIPLPSPLSPKQPPNPPSNPTPHPLVLLTSTNSHPSILIPQISQCFHSLLGGGVAHVLPVQRSMQDRRHAVARTDMRVVV